MADVETVGHLRELIEGVPDDAKIALFIRMSDDPDHFYEPVFVECCSSVDVTRYPVLVLHAPEPWQEGNGG